MERTMKIMYVGCLFFLTAMISLALADKITKKQTPTPIFPVAMSYFVELYDYTMNASFVGTHYFNSIGNLGRVDWLITQPKQEPWPFMLVFDGPDQQLYTLVQGDDGLANCTVGAYNNTIFNLHWANKANYIGVSFFEGRLCNEWDNVYPFFVQADELASTYYADYFTSEPAGFVNKDIYMVYSRHLNVTTPDDYLFLNIENLSCKPRITQSLPDMLYNTLVSRSESKD